MSFAPHGSYYSEGVLRAADSPDSLYPRRVALVVFGLAAALVAFAEFILSMRGIREGVARFAPNAAAFLACAVVGWRSYPYWVMGVYQVAIGSFPPRDQDPKSLIPMIWIGDLWRLPVILLDALCFLAIPALAILTILALRQRRFVAAAITAFCTGVSLTFMLAFSPGYSIWLMD